MSIFGKIKDAIFGRKAQAAEPAPTAPAAAAPAAAAPAAAAAPTPISEVDVAANLQALQDQKGANLNWRTSIVDLLKLIDVDASLANRAELAKELGYPGSFEGSAEGNIWLHKAVLRELAKNGGKVPSELLD